MGPPHIPSGTSSCPVIDRAPHPGPPQPKRRPCLLKGCERPFQPQPNKALQRYCSRPCRGEADRWSSWTAQKKYRASPKGREKRRLQALRYRERCKNGRRTSASEGHTRRNSRGEKCCDRPGCYETFRPTSRSPLQRFCSRACRRALIRVLERERRWAAAVRRWQDRQAHHRIASSSQATQTAPASLRI